VNGRGLTHDLAGLKAVEIAGDGVGEGSRHVVEYDAARRHADQPVAVIAGEVEAVQVADDGDAEVLVDVQQGVHHHLGVARV